MCCFGGIEEFVVVAFYDVSHIFQAPIANFYVISIKGFMESVEYDMPESACESIAGII